MKTAEEPAHTPRPGRVGVYTRHREDIDVVPLDVRRHDIDGPAALRAMNLLLTGMIRGRRT